MVVFPLVFAVGLLAGAFANWLIYTVAYHPRAIGPWKTPHADAPRRLGVDRLPLIGWWNLRRESAIHGRGYWIRPLLIELALGIFFVYLYRFHTGEWFLGEPFRAAGMNWCWTLFAVHVFLMTLLTAATFIDFDEQTIPDWITFPGTLVGLVLTAISTKVLLPVPSFQQGKLIEPVLLTSPNPWSVEFDGMRGLMIGLFIVFMWCFALADRRWITRKGYRKAVEYFVVRLLGDPFLKLLLVTWGVVSCFVIGVWYWGGEHWQGLLSGLMGLAIGGGVVWAVRLIAGWAMETEAMGFGDVILMGMVGIYLGWQAAVIAFFLAPVTAIVIVVVYYFVTGEKRVPFGPYLCAASVLVILGWSRIWEPGGGLHALFAFPMMLFAIFVFGLVMMAVFFKLMRLGQR